jgi:hypothetical protein
MEERNYLKNNGSYVGSVILKQISNKQDVRASNEFIWLRTGESGRFCIHCNEHVNSIKGR